MWWNRFFERRQNLNTLENPLYMRDLEEKMKATIALDRMTKRKQAREQVEGIYADTSFSWSSLFIIPRLLLFLDYSWETARPRYWDYLETARPWDLETLSDPWATLERDWLSMRRLVRERWSSESAEESSLVKTRELTRVLRRLFVVEMSFVETSSVVLFFSRYRHLVFDFSLFSRDTLARCKTRSWFDHLLILIFTIRTTHDKWRVT